MGDVEQPRISAWPGLDPEPAEAADASVHVGLVVPTGRVLPALNDAVAAWAPPRPEPKRRGRPRRRPAIEPELPIKVDEDAPVSASSPEMPMRETGEPVADAAEKVHATDTLDVEAKATLVPRKSGRLRLARSEFQPGERWKARLPAAVHIGLRKRVRR